MLPSGGSVLTSAIAGAVCIAASATGAEERCGSDEGGIAVFAADAPKSCGSDVPSTEGGGAVTG